MTKNTKSIIPLANMEVSQEGVINALEGGANFHTRLQALNIRVGKKIKKISNAPFRGPVVVEVDNSRVAIGHGMARKVMVEIMERTSLP